MDYLDEPYIIISVLKCGRGRQNCHCVRVMSLLAVTMERGHQPAKEYVSTMWKSQEKGSSLSAPKVGRNSASALILAQCKAFQTPDL